MMRRPWPYTPMAYSYDQLTKELCDQEKFNIICNISNFRENILDLCGVI